MGRRGHPVARVASPPMAVTHGQIASPALVDRLREAGGVMVMRDGHPVAANFGSTATEVAVCVKRVGLAVRSDLAVLDVTGAEPWFASLLAEPLGQSVPSQGRARRIAGTWCCRVASDRAVVVGPWDATAPWTQLASDSADARAVLTLVGPRAHQVLADVGLQNDLEIEGLREGWFADSPTLLLRESADRYLLVVDAEQAGEAWRALLDAGRSLGLSMVGADALARLAAAPAPGIF
jgi:glycine cleavage system aminomethyltransferase T